MLIFVYFKIFVRNGFSLPVYVNVTHFVLFGVLQAVLVGWVGFEGEYRKGFVVYY